MTQYDKSIPPSLKRVQDWFSDIITRPLESNLINPISKEGVPISSEAIKYITPSPTLQPHERIQIYNQQYWWKLLSTLHENFPLMVRLTGYNRFNNQIGVPYLKKYNPHHWSIDRLGDRLPLWMSESYSQNDRALMVESASVDCAYTQSFFAGEYSISTLQSENHADILKQTFYLQPHLHLMHLTYDLLPYRDRLIEHSVDYWDTHSLPKPKKDKYFFVIYRNQHYNTVWSRIKKSEYSLLSYLKEGKSIDAICQFIEDGADELRNEALQNLHLWFQEWVARRWIGIIERV